MNNFNLNKNCLGPQIKMRKVHIYEKKNPHKHNFKNITVLENCKHQMCAECC